jgi:hypothetical protein
MTIKDAFRLTRIELLWCIIIIMLGINMYWSAVIVQPVLDIARNQIFVAKIGIAQNERIIDILTNGTNETRDIVANIIRDDTSQR